MLKAILCGSFVLFGLAAHAGPVPTPLNVGVYPSYPPLDMRDPATGALKGFDIDLAAKLSEKLGAKFDFQETAFAQLIPSVQTGRIKLFFNGMYDTVPRRELITFVDYMTSGDQFVIRSEDKAHFGAETDICGKTVAGSRSTTALAHVAEWSKEHCEAKGLAAIITAGADNSIDARSQLKQKRVDAIVQDSLTIPYVASLEPGTYTALGMPFGISIMGIGVDKSDPEFQKALAGALQSIVESGDYAALMQKWGLPATSAIARAAINGG